MIPVPNSSTLPIQLPIPQDATVSPRPFNPSFVRTCAPSQAPEADGAKYEELTWGQLHDQCSQRGYRKIESEAVLETRLSTMDAAEAKRISADTAQEDEKRERAPVKGVKVSDNPTTPADLVGNRQRAPAIGANGLGYSHAVFGFDP